MSPSPRGNLGAQASGHFPPMPLCMSIPVRPHESQVHLVPRVVWALVLPPTCWVTWASHFTPLRL